MAQVVSTLAQLDASQLQQKMQSTVEATQQNVVDIGSNKQFVFFAAFDGTNNDRNNLALSGFLWDPPDPQMTNAAQLEKQVFNAIQGNSNVATGYYTGPGTGSRLDMSSWLGPSTGTTPWSAHL